MKLEKERNLQQQRKMWSIHKSVQGNVYYFNKVLNKSQWQMPECLRTDGDNEDHPDWKQCKAADGRVFYHNVRTKKSVWNQPEQLKLWLSKKQLDEKRKEVLQLKSQGEELEVQALQELKERFLNVLKLKGVNLQSKWDHTLKLVGDDSAFRQLRLRDKKQVFQDYQRKLREIEKQENKLRSELSKHNFQQMLRERRLTSDAKYHKVKNDFVADSRWRALDDAERSRLFQDFMDELYTFEKENQKAKRAQLMEALKTELERKRVPDTMLWKEFQKSYQKHHIVKQLHSVDLLAVFSQYIREKRNSNAQELQKCCKEDLRMARVGFRKLLISKVLKGQITHKSKWRHVVQDLAHQPLLGRLLDEGQTLPHQIFQDLLEQIQEVRVKAKGQLKRLSRERGIKSQQLQSATAIRKQLQELQVYRELRDYLKQYLQLYLAFKIKKQIQQQKDLKLRKDSAFRRQLLKIIKNLEGLSRNSPYFQFASKIALAMERKGLGDCPQSLIQEVFYSTIGQTSQEPKLRKMRRVSESGRSAEEGQIRSRSSQDESAE